MPKSIYFTAVEGNAGTQAVASAYLSVLQSTYQKVGVFRAFTNGPVANDTAFTTLLEQAGRSEDLENAWGVTRTSYIDDETAAMNQLITRYVKYAESFDAVLILGVLDNDPEIPGVLARTGRAAANLGTSVAAVVSGALRTPTQVRLRTQAAIREIESAHAPVTALIVADAAANLSLDLGSTPTVLVPEGTQAAFDGQDARTLIAAVEHGSTVVTPLAFQAGLIARAHQDKKTIVMPEAEDDRILYATAELLARDVANIVLVGDEASVRARAKELNINIDAAQIVALDDPERVQRYATKFAELRAKKGVTYEQAVEKLKDPSYFGTMMVYMGEADGMVSGANHTTANTIVPSFQTIKTKPGTRAVSGSFLMLLEDRVWVFADCAVNTNPTPEDLADIARSSAETARAFGVDPKVAMLSYSTGTSGKGPDVDAVVEATRLAKEQNPDLAIEGPIQFDAAVSPAVADKKLPGSPVAGRANVFIFPTLNAGNIGYKAVQRSSGAVAIGPLLQGLNKPVNDLSRGALVEDIINTVAITAIQAQQA
ncbi:phosphate acetyltransferase [Neoactinobaculum massilliense]|uniref:phosphate acetyltransferase n=1 Tax=Neoactinobaculum massilliense TaxID=2364794 RepID=UPI001F152346|nr:phosphate acetyltransferase [Neoactinobaculum massilliense]